MGLQEMLLDEKASARLRGRDRVSLKRTWNVMP
jgi:hypothetical protein